jgi:hypothetical protein
MNQECLETGFKEGVGSKSWVGNAPMATGCQVINKMDICQYLSGDNSGFPVVFHPNFLEKLK